MIRSLPHRPGISAIRNLSVVLVVFAFPFMVRAQVVVEKWNFEDQNAIVDIYTPENSGRLICRENTLGVTTLYPAGNQGSAISTDHWDNGNGSKYWMIEVNTSYTRTLVVKWDQFSDSSGPKDFRMQYRIGTSGAWTPAFGNDIVLANSVWVSNSYLLPAACNNVSSVFLRWIMISNLATGGGQVAVAGQSMMDNITITGLHDYSCFTYGYLPYYTCGAEYTFPTSDNSIVPVPPPGAPGAPDYGSCWKNINSGDRPVWLVMNPSSSGQWTFVFTPTTGNVNAWIWGGYSSLPNECGGLQNLVGCNNGAGGNPIMITFNIVAGMQYVILVTNPTGTNSSVTITNTEGSAIMDPPTGFGADHCGPASLTLRATGANAYENYKWYDSQSGGTLLKRSANNQDSTFITPVLTTTTTYWVSRVLVIPGPPVDSCESSRTPVVAAISSFPVVPDKLVSTPPVLCFKYPHTISLTATGGFGTTLQWFSGSCGSTQVGTGNPLILSPPAITTTFYARYETVCGVSACDSLTVNVKPEVTSGSIAADQTICQGGDPLPLTNNTPGSGFGNITYRWEMFSGTGPWTIIAGMTGSDYDPPAGLAVTTLYRRVTISTEDGDSCESPPTNPVTVTVNTVTPGIVGNDQQICLGENPLPFVELSGAACSGVLSYQWQTSVTGCSGLWTNIPGADSATYTPPSGLSLTSFYRRVVTCLVNGICCSAISDCIIVSVSPDPATSPIYQN